MKNIGTIRIETNRLILRRFEMSDSEDVLEIWASKPEIQQMYSEPVYESLCEVRELLQKYIDSYKSRTTYRWAVIEKTSEKCIGQIAFFLVDAKNNFAELEYCIGTDYQCRGYMTEAVRAVIKFGFEQMHLHKIQICTKEMNTPSKRVIEKCGLTYEGMLRDYFYMDGEYVGRLYYSMLESEYFNK